MRKYLITIQDEPPGGYDWRDDVDTAELIRELIVARLGFDRVSVQRDFRPAVVSEDV